MQIHVCYIPYSSSLNTKSLQIYLLRFLFGSVTFDCVRGMQAETQEHSDGELVPVAPEAPKAPNANLSRLFAGTPAGRMMKQLYPSATYTAPKKKFKTNPLQGPQPTMLNLNSTVDASDPRRSHFNRRAVAVLDANRPLPVQKVESPVAPIDMIKGTLRSKSAIEAKLAKEVKEADVTMQPLRPGRNTEAEIRKLQNLFTFKGGRALPSAGLPEPLEGNVPLTLQTNSGRPKAHRLVSSARLSRSQTLQSPLLKELLETERVLLQSEQEAGDFLVEMDKLGSLTSEMETQFQVEQTQRLASLKAIREKIEQERQRISSTISKPLQSSVSADRPHTVGVSSHLQFSRLGSPHRSPLKDENALLHRTRMSLDLEPSRGPFLQSLQEPRIVSTSADATSSEENTSSKGQSQEEKMRKLSMGISSRSSARLSSSSSSSASMGLEGVRPGTLLELQKVHQYDSTQRNEMLSQPSLSRSLGNSFAVGSGVSAVRASLSRHRDRMLQKEERIEAATKGYSLSPIRVSRDKLMSPTTTRSPRSNIQAGQHSPVNPSLLETVRGPSAEFNESWERHAVDRDPMDSVYVNSDATMDTDQSMRDSLLYDSTTVKNTNHNKHIHGEKDLANNGLSTTKSPGKFSPQETRREPSARRVRILSPTSNMVY